MTSLLKHRMKKNSKLSEITRIEIQKKNKNRYSVFLDEEFAFGIDQDVLLSHGLHKGIKLSQKQIDEIQFADRKKSAKDRALRFLSYRDRSEKELRDKLKGLDYDEMIISWVISELKRLQLIDDQNFAYLFSKNKIFTKPCGEYLLRRELKIKGISDRIIDETIKRIYAEKDQYGMAYDVALKKYTKDKDKIDTIKLKKRISDLLLRRGFNWEIVRDVLEKLEI